MKMKENGIKASAVVKGLLVIIAGILLFLFNVDILPIEYKSIVFSWQSILIMLGVILLFSRDKWGGGSFLILFGGFMLLRKLNIESIAFLTDNGWSLILIVGGILILCKTIWGRKVQYRRREYNELEDAASEYNTDRSRPQSHYSKNESGYIDRNCIFGGSKEKINYSSFKGGEINCVFGGIELDLSDSELAEGVNTLELNSVFGGIVLFVPVDWNIEIRQTQVFGNFEDKRSQPDFEVRENKVLILKVASVFGGGEIKSKYK